MPTYLIKIKTMKKIFLLLIAILSFTACSNEDDNSALSELDTKLLGRWLFENPTNNPSINNSFTFASDGSVTYSYWDGNSGNNYLNEMGTFSFTGDVMEMTFPEGVSLTFIQKVVFVNDNVVEFQPTGISGENAYEGDYFRDGADSYETPDDGKRFVYFDTGNVLNSAFGSSCYGLSDTNENINVKLSFLSNGVEVNSQNYSEQPGYQVDKVVELMGNEISVKLELLDFNPNILDKDIFIYDISVRIENGVGTTIANQGLGELYYCTESRYEVIYTYDNDSNTSSVEEQTHSF